MNETLVKDAILKVGEVSGIEGRKVFISLERDKNASDLLFDGEILKNISVGSYIEIRKGFMSLIGKVEGEKLEEEVSRYKDIDNQYHFIDKNKRTLTVKLSGYIATNGKFIGGIKELPLIGNEAYLLTEEKIHTIHDLLKKDASLRIEIAKTDIEEIPISFPVDGLFNSHIAIFGNTGSGKSNTLAALYQSLFSVLLKQQNFRENSRYFFFDFNGEYTKETCLTQEKTVYNLSTRNDSKDKIPMTFDELMDIETLAILLEATEKTQKPFLKRALKYYKQVKNSKGIDGKDDSYIYFRNILKKDIRNTLQMVNKDIATKILDYIVEIVTCFIADEAEEKLRDDINYQNKYEYFYFGNDTNNNFSTCGNLVEQTKIYKKIESLTEDDLKTISELQFFFIFILIQLIHDLFHYKTQIDHIAPVINRFKAKQKDIERVFEIKSTADIWAGGNIVLLNLYDVNLDMRKTIPLLMAKHIYNLHKQQNNEKSLSIIIDEAHNILSKTSFRENEDWKDYRLETFEEIIKEGRKFGVFVTIASQRPNDISDTIISQAHNYFIHQLINQRDLQTIGNAVSYIDKVTEESIPTLSIGTCVFSGIATPMPLKIKIDELPDDQKPDSHTLRFEKITGP